MLHATLPSPYPWSGMSLPGPDVHPGVRGNGGGEVPFNHQLNHNPALQTPHAYTDNNMCQQQVPSTLHNFHHAYNNYPPPNINNQTTVMRTIGRISHDGSMRHASGGSHTSSHRGTPPSPDDQRGHNMVFNQNHMLERGNRASFDQCNNPRDSQGNTGPPILLGSSPRGRMPPSPASMLPQKTAFDLTTPINMVGHNTSLYKAPPSVSEPSSVPTSVLRPPSSAYQMTKVKQEPGSPAQYTTLNPLGRGVKQESSHPQSPQSMNATPPPTSTPRPPYTQMERKRIAPNANRPSFSYPSPQSSNPISPASNGEIPRPDSTFRYQNNPVQNPSPGESSTCNSAISSREGTPGPRLWAPEEMAGPAPNVDISRVLVKEEVRYFFFTIIFVIYYFLSFK